MTKSGQIASGPRSKTGRILVVEDEFVSRHALLRLLNLSGYTARAASSGEEALRVIGKENGIDAILVDLDLPGMDGLEFIHMVTERHPSVLAILITAHNNDSLDELSHGMHVHRLHKPLDYEQLLRLLRENSTIPTPKPGFGRSTNN